VVPMIEGYSFLVFWLLAKNGSFFFMLGSLS
jgi:hypothetical protein